MVSGRGYGIQIYLEQASGGLFKRGCHSDVLTQTEGEQQDEARRQIFCTFRWPMTFMEWSCHLLPNIAAWDHTRKGEYGYPNHVMKMRGTDAAPPTHVRRHLRHQSGTMNQACATSPAPPPTTVPNFWHSLKISGATYG